MNNTDFKAGQFVTVVEWKNVTDRSYVGDLLEIRAIDYPFVVCSFHTGGMRKKVLNLDRVTIREVSQEFVEALLPKEEGRPEYIKCIDNKNGDPMCGETDREGWKFTSIKQAVDAAKTSRLLACRECLIEALDSTYLKWETGPIPDGTGLVLIVDGIDQAYSTFIERSNMAPYAVRWCKLPIED